MVPRRSPPLTVYELFYVEQFARSARAVDFLGLDKEPAGPVAVNPAKA